MSAEEANPLTREGFAALTERTFELVSEELPGISLELHEVNAIGGDSEAREPFSVIFLGPLEPILPQGIRRLRHPGLGVLDLFLVPIGPDRDGNGIQYEAVFS